MNWTQEEYDRLAAYYRDCDDERLRTLASFQDELTMIARELLGKELDRRAIDSTSSPLNLSEEVEEPSEWPDEIDLLWKYASLAPEECTFLFMTDREAYAASALLLEAGIQSVVLGDREATPSDLRIVRAVVKPGDQTRAAEVLSAPLPERLLQEADTDPGDFIEPVCPACGAADPLLQSIEPFNQWFCEECGETWQDTLPEDDEEAEKADR